MLFKKLGPRTTDICDTVNIPSVCKIQSLEPNLTFKCPMPVLIDNIQQYCLVTFEKNDFTIELNKVKLSSDFPIPIVQSNVEGIIHNEYFPKSFCEEKMSTTYDNSYKVVMRSKFCKQIVDWLATRNTACTSCHELHHARKRREKKRKLEVNSEAENKENKRPERDTGKVTKSSMFEISCEQKDQVKDTVITLDEEDHEDMEKILNYVSKCDLPEEFVVLLKSQLQKL